MTTTLGLAGAPAPSLVTLFRARAQAAPDELAYAFLGDGEVETARLTYRELDLRARAVAVALARHGQLDDRALLLMLPGLDFVVAFVGCLYAGRVAVPVSLPNPRRLQRTLAQLQGIVANADPGVVLTNQATLERVPAESVSLFAPRPVPVIAVDACDVDAAAAWHEPLSHAGSLALLQYTSGSTAAPRGVMVSHGNLLHNLHCICAGHGQRDDNLSVSWLPIYHDMGLIGGVLGPAYGGFPAYLMPPEAFLRQPVLWLRALSRYRASYTGGPNFAYELCLARIEARDCAGLDLRHWRAAYNGAEPVRASTLTAFAERFAPYGLSPSTLQPSYGLAEATLKVTTKDEAARCRVRRVDALQLTLGRAVESAAARGVVEVVSCGPPVADTEVRVVDPEHCTAVADGSVGEIWVRGPGVARGYWRTPDLNAQTFGAQLAGRSEGGFLRTGDLGFLLDGELYVTGRLKDLIILRGRKLHAHDIEHTVEQCHPLLRSGGVAAFAVADGRGVDGERLVVMAEVQSRGQADPAVHFDAALGNTVEAVAELHDARVSAVALVPERSLSKTSSGKLQRARCRAAYLAGEVTILAHWGTQPCSLERGAVEHLP